MYKASVAKLFYNYKNIEHAFSPNNSFQLHVCVRKLQVAGTTLGMPRAQI